MKEHVSILPSNSFHLYPWLKQFSLILRTKSFTRYNPIRQCWPTTHSPCLLLTKSLIASCSLRRRPFFNMSLQGQVMNTVIPFLRKTTKFWKDNFFLCLIRFDLGWRRRTFSGKEKEIVGQLPKHSQAIMFSKEFRPLKRPKLGIPDYYPQDDKQKEVCRHLCFFFA